MTILGINLDTLEVNSTQKVKYDSVQYNSGRPLAIFQPSDAVDRSMQPLIGHLC